MVNVSIQSGTTRGKAKGASAPPTLPQSIRKLNPKWKHLNMFWTWTVSKRKKGLKGPVNLIFQVAI